MQPEILAQFQEVLAENSSSFVASLLQVIADDKKLAKADPESIKNAALLAAVLRLPVVKNLGFAYILPYSVKQSDGSYKTVAQFQVGYRGYVQLAIRTGEYKTISSAAVYEGQLLSENPLTGNVYDWNNKLSDKIVGFVAYFELKNGFSAEHYMDMAAMQKHASVFSDTYSKTWSAWNKYDGLGFVGMARKTVLKLLLSKEAPLSIDMQKAIMADQAQVLDVASDSYRYIDNEGQSLDDKLEEIKERFEKIGDGLPQNHYKGIKAVIDGQKETSYSKVLNYLIENEEIAMMNIASTQEDNTTSSHEEL